MLEYDSVRSRDAVDVLARPPLPEFFKVRRDPPSLLTPLRRQLRDVYVRASERGWFGLVPLQTHVVICGFGRAGSTLLHVMLSTSVEHAKSFGRERSAISVARYTWPGRFSTLISKKPSDIFRVDEIREYYRSRRTSVRFILTVRDPRAVLTSIFSAKPGYNTSPEKWRAVYEHVQYQRQFPDVMISEYRDLVERPAVVQQRVAAFTGCRMRQDFESFHSRVPEHYDTRQLNGLRPLDPATRDKWRRPEHRSRIQEMLREMPELPQRLIDMGYETDSSWTAEYV